MLAMAFATILNAFHFFGLVRPDLRPKWKLVPTEGISQIATLGSLFFVPQLAIVVAYSADNFLIARSLGAINIPEFSIPQQLFSLVTIISSILMGGLWVAYGEAISRGDLLWVRNTIKN